MTRKIYKSAMGKTVDLGALLLQNEQVRAVGNMGVNAAGDLLDSTNRVIDQRNRQVQRQYKRQSNVSNIPAANSNLAARKANEENSKKSTNKEIKPKVSEEPVDHEVKAVTEPTTSSATGKSGGGLAAAIARSKEIKQELEKTRREQEQERLRKI